MDGPLFFVLLFRASTARILVIACSIISRLRAGKTLWFFAFHLNKNLKNY
jgi:hypothetical protein